ncbi:sensor histidine kinase, partial [bacterium]|nr:sensor histidine kinase [bacterium]
MKFHLYQYKSFFKTGLFISALLMMVMLFFYIERMVSNLREENRAILETYANVYAKVGSEDISEFRFFFEEIIQKTTFPLIITDLTGEPAQWQGIGISYFDRTEGNLKKIRNLVKKMKKASKPVPLYLDNVLFQYIYYGDTQSIKFLGMLPYVGVLAVGLFILIGFIGFNNIRRSEQRFLWVGMAKETAHQLGTPISSLMGWHEILKYG